MLDLCDPKTIKELMAAFGLSFRKEFGQNFLADRATVAAIAGACGGPDIKTVLEIGAGCGSLTQELALRYENVVAVEIDRGLQKLLKFTLGEHANVRVAGEDITKADLAALMGDSFSRGGVAVCANLPYYITTPVITRLLGSGLPFDNVTVMVQSEVADRLCAVPGAAEYGSVTAFLNYYGVCRRLMEVPRSLFVPPPKVDSSVVRIDMYVERPLKPADEKLFFRVIRAAFGQRRKTLPNALSAGIPELTKAEHLRIVGECGLDPSVRGETLSCAAFCGIADRIAARIAAGTAPETEGGARTPRESEEE